MKNELLRIIGSFPSESAFKTRMRFHQGWWRACVLVEEEGNRPHNPNEKVCNTLINGELSKKNFLSQNINLAVEQTIKERRLAKNGIIAEDRLFNNLLSSQPLCFNFFGEFKNDLKYALLVIRQFWPEIQEVRKVIFEFAPLENYSKDNSAFDVAFEVRIGKKLGLIGLECKYTDTFSKTEYDRKEYRQIFSNAKGAFLADYEAYIAAEYNQLFRNEILAEGLIQNGQYDFVYTGLFCHPEDDGAIKTGEKFQAMLNRNDKSFKVITYMEFIEKMQQLDISWEHRELSMLLWVRYCGMKLSELVFQLV